MHVAVPSFWLSFHKDCSSARSWINLMPIRAHTSDKITPLASLLFDALNKFSDDMYEPYLTLKLQPQNRQFSFGDMSTINFLRNFDKRKVFTCVCLQRKWNSTSVALPDWPWLRHDRYSSVSNLRGWFSNFQVLLAGVPFSPLPLPLPPISSPRSIFRAV